MRSKIILLTIILGLSNTTRALSQGISDLRARMNAGVLWEPIKQLDVTARYRLTTHQNTTVFLRSMFSVNAAYKIIKGVEAGAEYRYNTAYKGDFHRFFVFAKVKYPIGDFDISYRLRYQQDQDYFNNEYLQSNPAEKVFRSKLSLKYAYSKKMDLYMYAEHFSSLENQQLSPYRVRYGVGVQYMYKRRHDVSLEFFINDEFNQRRPEDIAAIDVSYVYHLKKKKKKAAIENETP